MHPRRALHNLVIGLRLYKAGAVICSSNLLVDDFSRFSNRRNNLGLKASDDGSMTSISVLGDSISFTPRPMSYFYETVPCVDAEASGYEALAFTMKAPQNASITLEMQTMENCSIEAYNSTWRYVMNFTGEPQRIVAPVSSFRGARTNGIAAFNWATWESQSTGFVWELGDIELICGAVS
ncbi:hypothetical protein F4813DRAFT_391977 [Daldinia decipiens]|uniref:uncharacterized protein n=1 Tax=Daldinia decipiens TaxID=326647 RepID=UPI0020C4F37E|nr:uncharacterized protein F4813DRAFT_391977 [Daldinia decipiens]KAI1655265.1 hypothetical protein F4813DRAFT_391977 [Daldinia decipiens]